MDNLRPEARDHASFKPVCCSGVGPANLGKVKVHESLRFPNEDGFLFNQILIKKKCLIIYGIFGVRP